MFQGNLEEQRSLVINNEKLIIKNYFKLKNYSLKKAAFTLAEGATHVAICNSKRKTAFTLAEVLITLAIIGVVAAITMPVLMSKINDRVNFERHANIAYKITQAMEQMRAHGKLVQYTSTDAFVDELQKYLKIQKRCSASNIAECWPTETITDASGEEYPVRKAKQRKNILKDSVSGNPDDNNVGLILADGAAIILTYNKDAEPVDISSPVKAITIDNPKGQKIAYSTTSTGAIDFLTDVNGKKGPNREGSDIKSFSSAHFAKSGHPCDDGPQGCLWLAPTYSPINCCMTAENMATAEYQTYCGSGYANTTYCAKDSWAGAKKICAEAGMTLPTFEQLKLIYAVKDLYSGSNANIASTERWLWSSTESDSYNAWHLHFSNGNDSNDEKHGYDIVYPLCMSE